MRSTSLTQVIVCYKLGSLVVAADRLNIELLHLVRLAHQFDETRGASTEGPASLFAYFKEVQDDRLLRIFLNLEVTKITKHSSDGFG